MRVMRSFCSALSMAGSSNRPLPSAQRACLCSLTERYVRIRLNRVAESAASPRRSPSCRASTDPPPSRRLVEDFRAGFSRGAGARTARDRGVQSRAPPAHAERYRPAWSTCRARRCGARSHTLVRLGYAETDDRLFRLTPRILNLARAYLSSNADLRHPAAGRRTAERGHQRSLLGRGAATATTSS